MYRIPVIITLSSGAALIFYLASNPDRQTIFMRRSMDDGKTWSDRAAIVNGEKNESIHNPVAIAERQGKTVHFLWHKNHDRCFYQRSADDGVTWSEPVEITSVFKRYDGEYHWLGLSAGPGHAIQLKNGRIVVPFWMASGKAHRPSVVSTIYSDDSGKTWGCGEIIRGTDTFINPNETTVVELRHGGVLVSMRHESLTHRRAFAFSADGATGWSNPGFDMELKDPICHACLTRLSPKGDQELDGILFSNCDWEDRDCLQAKSEGKTINWSDDARRKLTVRLSLDDAATWSYSQVLEAYSGYSDLAVSTDQKTIFCLYERNWINGSCINTKNLALARFNIEWLTNGEMHI